MTGGTDAGKIVRFVRCCRLSNDGARTKSPKRFALIGCACKDAGKPTAGFSTTGARRSATACNTTMCNT
jgi:hypothetical protein